MSQAVDSVVSLLGRILTRRERDRAPVRAVRVLGRYADGTERIQRLDATCVTRGAPDNHYSGSVITAPAVSPFHRSGSTGIVSFGETAADILWVERLDPEELRPGQSYTITVTGRGFDERVRIEFLEPPGEIGADALRVNEDVTIVSLLYVDSTTLELQVNVADGARLYPAGAPISFGRV